MRIFTILGQAEAKAHGATLETVHFHEVGAVDSIVDITAAAVCLDDLGIEDVIVPVLYEGTGSIRCAHGVLPIPVPAVVNIAAAEHLNLHITGAKGEYVTPTEYLGGQVIRIAENSGDYINPLDISLAYGSDDPETKSSPVPAKVSFIQSLVRMMASSVNDAQANVLDAAAAYAYNRYLDDPRPENLPTLQDIYDFLMSEQGSDMRDARDLAKLIRRYVTGTLSLFNHPTNVDLQSNLVCFDLHELSSELKPLALLIILDHIWVRVSANRRAGRRTWLVIDEFQLLLDSPYARSQIDRFFTRGGKWDFYINAITQNLSRVLNSEETRYMFQNSPFVTVLQQTSDLLPDFQELFNLSESQTKVLATAHPGEGLYVFKNRVVHFDFPIDQKICPTLYDICTDPSRRYQAPGGEAGAGEARRRYARRAGGRPVIVFAFET